MHRVLALLAGREMQTNSIYPYIHNTFSITTEELHVEEYGGSAVDHYVRFALTDAKAAGLIWQPSGAGSPYSITSSGKNLIEKYTINDYMKYAEIELRFTAEYRAVKRKYEKTSLTHLHVIDDKDDILRYQHELASRLYGAGERKRGKCGFQGGVIEVDMYWFPEERFWWGYMPPEGPTDKHWNAFGLEEPLGGPEAMDITCEVNFPASNGTWSVAGALAEDESGEVYVVHSGRIGGGRKDIGRDLFVEHFAGSRQWADVERNGRSKDVVVVSALDDSALIQNLAYFIKEVRRIKGLAGRGKPSPPPPGTYRQEFGGYRQPYSTKGEIRAGVEHGRIVASLHDLAVSRGFNVWNNQYTDLFLRKRGTALVEVKTKDDSQSRYTAIGQLLYHSKNDDDVLVAVFPSIDERFKRVLRRLGIASVTWHKSGHTYGFDCGLYEALGRL